MAAGRTSEAQSFVNQASDPELHMTEVHRRLGAGDVRARLPLPLSSAALPLLSCSAQLTRSPAAA